MYQESGAPWRCAVITEQLSHYREGVYKELDAEPAWEFIFFGGKTALDGSIPEIPKGKLRDHRILKNLNLPGSLLWQSRIVRFSMTTQIDAAIFTGNARFLSTWVSSTILRIRKKHVLFWTTGWHRPDTNPLVRNIRRLFYSIPHDLLLYGEDGRDIALASGLPRHKLHIVGNSYSQTDETEHDRSLNPRPSLPELKPGRRYVGAVIRLTPQKRFTLLIEAVAILREQGEDVEIILVGSGPEEDKLRAHARNHEVPLHLLGAIHDRDTIARVYERLDLTVIPEFAGLTTVQSLQHGTPVVTTNDISSQAPEFRAISPGLTGELYNRGSSVSLSEAITRCLKNLQANEEQIVSASIQEAQQNWSPSSQARRILKVLQKSRPLKKRPVRLDEA